MTTTPDPNANQQTTPSIDRSIPNLQDLTDQRALNPQLPTGTSVDPIYQTVQEGEDLQYLGINPTAANTTAATATNTQAQVTNQQQTDTTALTQQGAGQYDATQIDPNTVPQVQAAQGQFTEDELLTGQLKKIMQPELDGTFPEWASGAMRNVQQMLAARGIDNSTMAGQAITAALLDAAVPIAQSNASAIQGIKLVNLNNEQQAALVNNQTKVQALLSNQAADNAAKQFNATSEQQVNEFIAQLADSVNKFNATAANTINTFNAQQETNTSLVNAQMVNQTNQANAAMTNAREQFNVNNANLIQQSNATWRRQLNTQNTALANEDARINALNKLQISNDAYNKVWQQFRDEASWVYESGQNDADRAAKMAMLVKQYQLAGSNTISAADNQMSNDLWQAIGSVGKTVIGNGVASIFDTNGDGSMWS